MKSSDQQFVSHEQNNKAGKTSLDRNFTTEDTCIEDEKHEKPSKNLCVVNGIYFFNFPIPPFSSYEIPPLLGEKHAAHTHTYP